MRLVHLGKGACYLPSRNPAKRNFLTDWCAVRAGLIDLIDRWQVALKLPSLAPGSLVLTGGRLFYAPCGAVVRWFDWSAKNGLQAIEDFQNLGRDRYEFV
jgi:hypothetical protein